uniref:Uncharacterized protein n=1 Tax=Aegilops tauschii subsp. strangulata TaxID=200361 RepID=A0A453LCH8_AEGTS
RSAGSTAARLPLVLFDSSPPILACAPGHANASPDVTQIREPHAHTTTTCGRRPPPIKTPPEPARSLPHPPPPKNNRGRAYS